MKTLQTLLTKLSATPLLIPVWVIISLIVVSLIGFLDATYLTATHYSGTTLPCSLLHGCEQVTNSEYSVILGIPVALMGAVYYLFMLLVSLLYLDTKKSWLLLLIISAAEVGFLFSVYFVYLMAFVIEAWCQYCLLSALTSTLLFILSLFIFKRISSALRTDFDEQHEPEM